MHLSRIAVVLITAMSTFACGCSHAGHPILVTSGGRIGPLKLDVSDRASVIAFAGKPDGTNTGEYLPDYGPFEALGYRCRGRRATDRGGFPSCATVFYINHATQRLEEFYTSERRYSGPAAVHVGMSAAEAQRRLHRRLLKVGCVPAFTLRSRPARLTIDFKGFRGSGHNNVNFLVLVSNRHAAGAFDCIDS